MAGAKGVGKTSILLQFQKGQFAEKPCLSSEFVDKSMVLQNNKYRIRVWDPPSKWDFRTTTSSWFNAGLDGLCIVYSVGDEESFVEADLWFTSYESKYKQDNKPILMLVGNKTDSHRVVSIEHGIEKASNWSEKYGKKVIFMECSCFSGHTEEVNSVFETLANAINNDPNTKKKFDD